MTTTTTDAPAVREEVLEAVGLTKHFPVSRRLRTLLTRTRPTVHERFVHPQGFMTTV